MPVRILLASAIDGVARPARPLRNSSGSKRSQARSPILSAISAITAVVSQVVWILHIAPPYATNASLLQSVRGRDILRR